VIDWGFGTLLPVEFDLGQLLVGLAHAGEADVSQLAAIDAEIFPAYLDGLAEEDYKVDPARVRAGYVGSLAAHSALCAIPVEKLGLEAPTAGLTEPIRAAAQAHPADGRDGARGALTDQRQQGYSHLK
jgi:hypothetical protein